MTSVCEGASACHIEYTYSTLSIHSLDVRSWRHEFSRLFHRDRRPFWLSCTTLLLHSSCKPPLLTRNYSLFWSIFILQAMSLTWKESRLPTKIKVLNSAPLVSFHIDLCVCCPKNPAVVKIDSQCVHREKNKETGSAGGSSGCAAYWIEVKHTFNNSTGP